VIDAPQRAGQVPRLQGLGRGQRRVADGEPGRGPGHRTALVCRFSINLIPHTIAVTTLKHLRARAAKVNLEIDLIARYVADQRAHLLALR
jgi:hypothetical protein